MVVAVAMLLCAGGCATTLPASDFITMYTTNIKVANTASSDLPERRFLGGDGDYLYIEDIVPASQGGGPLGTKNVYRTPAGSLPGNFLNAYKPGDVVFDARKGSKYTYMIESYRAAGGSERPATGEWAGKPPTIYMIPDEAKRPSPPVVPTEPPAAPEATDEAAPPAAAPQPAGTP
jgi:hypothetical protein